MHTNARYCTLLLSVPGPRDQRFKVKGLDNLRKASLSRLILKPVALLPTITTDKHQHISFPHYEHGDAPTSTLSWL